MICMGGRLAVICMGLCCSDSYGRESGSAASYESSNEESARFCGWLSRKRAICSSSAEPPPSLMGAGPPLQITAASGPTPSQVTAGGPASQFTASRALPDKLNYGASRAPTQVTAAPAGPPDRSLPGASRAPRQLPAARCQPGHRSLLRQHGSHTARRQLPPSLPHRSLLGQLPGARCQQGS